LISNPGNDYSPLQRLSVYHNLSCDRCAHDAEERKANVKRIWSTKCSQGKTRRHLDILISKRKKCKPPSIVSCPWL